MLVKVSAFRHRVEEAIQKIPRGDQLDVLELLRKCSSCQNPRQQTDH